MNKAFVREPDFDGRAYCPQCGELGTAVGAAALDHHILAEVRSRLGDSAWFCGFPRCDVAYFNLFEITVQIDELQQSVYPKDPDAPVCACFGLTEDDIEADAREPVPARIRALLERSKGPEARCQTLSADGQCCMPRVQRLYMKLKQQQH